MARDVGRLVMWYVPLILIGVFLGWLWSFLILTVLYLFTLTSIWQAAKKMDEYINAKN
jgi:predicted MFS family arabinose efflux permease